MNGREKLQHFISSAGQIIILAVCGISFMLGSFAALAYGSAETSIESVSGYITRYRQSLSDADAISANIVVIFFQFFIFPAFSFLSGFSVIGIIAVPALMFTKGFLITYISTILLSCCGTEYLTAALLLMGVDIVTVVPCFFAISVAAMDTSLSLLKTVTQRAPYVSCYNRTYFLRFAFVVPATLAAAFVQSFLLEQYILNAFLL